MTSAVTALAGLVLMTGCSQPEPIDLTGDSSEQVEPLMDSVMRDEATCASTVVQLNEVVGTPMPTDLAKPEVRDAAASIIGEPPADPTSVEAKRWRTIVLAGTYAADGVGGPAQFCAKTAHTLKLYPGELDSTKN